LQPLNSFTNYYCHEEFTAVEDLDDSSHDDDEGASTCDADVVDDDIDDVD